jgi:hypothetical protein
MVTHDSCPGSSAALHRFIGHILLSVLSGNTCVLPTLLNMSEEAKQEFFVVSSKVKECLPFTGQEKLF